MGKFRQLSPELWPLIDVKNSFPLSVEHFLTDFLQTLYIKELVLGRIGFEL